MRAFHLAPIVVTALVVTSAVVSSGCRRLDPIPEDADGAAAWLYRYQDADAPQEIIDAIDVVVDAMAVPPDEGFVEGLLIPLDAETVEVVGQVAVGTLPEEEQGGVTDEDLDAGTYVVLADQQGMVVASIIPCSVQDVVEVFVRTDQDVIHGGYDEYERFYTSEADALDVGGMLSWQTNYTVTVIGATYDATIEGQLRWIDEDNTYAVARAHLPEPGVFSSGGRYFRQDYQLDLFAPTDDGQTVHVFAVWRDMNLLGFHSSNAAYIATVSDAFREGDEEIGEVCNPETDR